MGEHDFRVNIDKAQRDEILEYLDGDIRAVKCCIGAEHELESDRKNLRILKSLKAMVESFDTTEKQVEDKGDVRHEQKTVTGNDVKKVARRWLITPFRLGESLKELGIKVTDKEG